MTWIDMVIIGLIALGAIRGFMNGFISQLAALAGLIVGFFVAKALYVALAAKLTLYIPDTSMTITQIIAFVAIWIIVPLLFALAGSIFTHAAKVLSLGGFNRILGFLLGGVKWVLLIGLFINVLEYIDTDNRFVKQTNKQESTLYYPIKDFVSNLFPVAKNITNEYIYT